MAFFAKILADSISPEGCRLTTFEVTFWRAILAEFNTHRMLSRNSASSRAIPVLKQLKRILTEPFIPEHIGINQPGMQATDYLHGMKYAEAIRIWLKGRDRAVATALELLLGEQKFVRFFGASPSHDILIAHLDEAIAHLDGELKKENPADTDVLNAHKQTVNRVLEPYMWHTVIVTATEWGNFWGLRAHPDAQPEIYKIAKMMKELHEGSTPLELGHGEWSLPLVGMPGDEDLDAASKVKVSAGRCARVSYLTHDGTRDPLADIALHDRLVGSGHMSPCEHPARTFTLDEWAERKELISWVKKNVGSPKRQILLIDQLKFEGNFCGFHQYRKDLDDESDYSRILQRLSTGSS